MYTLYLNLLRDMQHDAMVAWSYRQINATSFLSWREKSGTMVGVPQISGC